MDDDVVAARRIRRIAACLGASPARRRSSRDPVTCIVHPVVSISQDGVSLLPLRSISQEHQYETIKVNYGGEKNNIGLITLNRPKVLNALSDRLVHEVQTALEDMDQNPNIAVMIITGNEKAFAAGMDIQERVTGDDRSESMPNRLDSWNAVSNCKKPTIAAVNGYAVGGGCELAMKCDMILAGENAKFGQPEIKIGTIPGSGGTQRLVKAIGKSRAMEMCLTGNSITAKQACDWGLVSSVHPPEKLLDAAIELAEKIARNSKLMTSLCKKSINNSFEMFLKDGIQTERELFLSTFATDDFAEGMLSFVQKRKPNFKDK